MPENISEKIRLEFQRRMSLNSRYSLRAYARSVGVNVSIVSRIFSGHTAVSLKLLNRFSSSLGLSPEEYDFYKKEILERKKMQPEEAEVENEESA